jgi:hypothetical protein
MTLEKSIYSFPLSLQFSRHVVERQGSERKAREGGHNLGIRTCQPCNCGSHGQSLIDYKQEKDRLSEPFWI